MRTNKNDKRGLAYVAGKLGGPSLSIEIGWRSGSVYSFGCITRSGSRLFLLITV